LNPDNNYRPHKAVEEILRIFGDSLSGWGIASWFIGLNSFLDDQAPKDLLASDPQWTIGAARDAFGEMSPAWILETLERFPPPAARLGASFIEVRSCHAPHTI
jgi:hypothetical protein